MEPLKEYRNRLSARRAWRDQCAGRLHTVSWFRLAAGLSFFILLWLTFVSHGIAGWIVLGPVLVFVGLAIYHVRLSRQQRRATRGVAFYESGLDRIEDRWVGRGNSGAAYISENHPYAIDLDLFGKGSLFELLCTARTQSGESTLVRWLCAPSSRAEILRRQEAVEELRQNIDLREDLAVLGPEVRERVRPGFILAWAEAPPMLRSTAARIVAPLLAAALTAALVNWGLLGGSGWLFLAVLAAHRSFNSYFARRVKTVVDTVKEPANELRVLQAVMLRLEREQFSSARLCELRAELEASGKRPSGRIERFLEYLDFLWNEFFKKTGLSFLWLWSLQFAFAIEAWRRRNGRFLRKWLNAVGEIEALCALAGYAFEHPDDPFPEIVEDETLLDAVEVRHPLLPRSQSVPNSVRLQHDLQLLVVSGSNMSGKSTLLRTVGINIVLAQTGAPVSAKALRLSLFAIGATVRVQDSLLGGTSRFYAEIRRIQDIMELAEKKPPALFLLDEILHGTNSHDRAIGAEAIVRGLLDRRAIGLVTTHDLALAGVADALAPRAANVHFLDRLVDGRMVFDYRLHPGVVQKSNALELMRAVGLKL